jgi:hypothetical protein
MGRGVPCAAVALIVVIVLFGRGLGLGLTAGGLFIGQTVGIARRAPCSMVGISSFCPAFSLPPSFSPLATRMLESGTP